MRASLYTRLWPFDRLMLCLLNLIIKKNLTFYIYYILQKHLFVMDWKLKYVNKPTNQQKWPCPIDILASTALSSRSRPHLPARVFLLHIQNSFYSSATAFPKAAHGQHNSLSPCLHTSSKFLYLLGALINWKRYSGQYARRILLNTFPLKAWHFQRFCWKHCPTSYTVFLGSVISVYS